MAKPVRKRKTIKTGKYTQRTTTISDKGITQSFSSRPPGGKTRRTLSFHKGKSRLTHTTHHGGGWSTTRSKTLNPTVRTSSTKGNGENILGIMLIAMLYALVYPFINLWKTSKSIPRDIEEKWYKYYPRIIYYFMLSSIGFLSVVIGLMIWIFG